MCLLTYLLLLIGQGFTALPRPALPRRSAAQVRPVLMLTQTWRVRADSRFTDQLSEPRSGRASLLSFYWPD